MLAHMASRPDRTLQWRHPNRPLLCAARSRRLVRNADTLALDSPRSTTSIHHAVGSLAKQAGVLGRATPQSFRLGAARDTAHSKSSLQAQDVFTIGQELGHETSSAIKGKSIHYAGGPEIDYHADRLHNKDLPVARRSSIVGDKDGSAFKDYHAAVEQRLTTAQIDQALSSMSGLSSSRYCELSENEQSRVRRRAETARWEHLQKTSDLLPRDFEALPMLPAPYHSTPQLHQSQLLSEATVREYGQDYIDAVHVIPPRPALAVQDHPASSLQQDEQFVDADEQRTAFNPADEQQYQQCLAVEDALFGTLETQAPEDVSAVETESLFDLNEAAGPSIEEEETMSLLLPASTEQEAEQSNDPQISAEAWAQTFASVNVFTAYYMSVTKANAADVNDACISDQLPPTGNSRSPPALHIFYCETPGCKTSTAALNVIQQHRRSCGIASQSVKANEDTKDVPMLKCTEPGCPYEVKDNREARSNLKKHIQKIHEWVPKTCERSEECGVTKSFETGHQYDNHIAKCHQPGYPRACDVEDCEHVGIMNRKAHQTHLKDAHQISDDELEQHLPKSYKELKVWLPQTCPRDGCKLPDKQWGNPWSLVRHLTGANGHALSQDQAEALIASLHTTEVVEKVVKKRKSVGKTATEPKKRRYTKRKDDDMVQECPVQ